MERLDHAVYPPQFHRKVLLCSRCSYTAELTYTPGKEQWRSERLWRSKPEGEHRHHTATSAQLLGSSCRMCRCCWTPHTGEHPEITMSVISDFLMTQECTQIQLLGSNRHAGSLYNRRMFNTKSFDTLCRHSDLCGIQRMPCCETAALAHKGSAPATVKLCPPAAGNLHHPPTAQ